MNKEKKHTLYFCLVFHTGRDSPAGVLQPARSQTGGRGHGPPRRPGGLLPAPHPPGDEPQSGSITAAGGQETRLKLPCGAGEASGDLREGHGVPRAAGAVGAMDPSLSVLDAGGIRPAGDHPCQRWEQARGSQGAHPGKHRRCPGEHTGCRAPGREPPGKLGREETGLPPEEHLGLVVIEKFKTEVY